MLRIQNQSVYVLDQVDEDPQQIQDILNFDVQASLITFQRNERNDRETVADYLHDDLRECLQAIQQDKTNPQPYMENILQKDFASGLDGADNLLFCDGGSLRGATFQETQATGNFNSNIADYAFRNIGADQGQFGIREIDLLYHTEPKALSNLAEDIENPEQEIQNRQAPQIGILISFKKMCKQCARLVLGMAKREAQSRRGNFRLPERFWAISGAYLKNVLIETIAKEARLRYIFGNAKERKEVFIELQKAFEIDLQEGNKDFTEVVKVYDDHLKTFEKRWNGKNCNSIIDALFAMKPLSNLYFELASKEGNGLRLLRNS